MFHGMMESTEAQALHDPSLVSRKADSAFLQRYCYFSHFINLNSHYVGPHRGDV